MPPTLLHNAAPHLSRSRRPPWWGWGRQAGGTTSPSSWAAPPVTSPPQTRTHACSLPGSHARDSLTSFFAAILGSPLFNNPSGFQSPFQHIPLTLPQRLGSCSLTPLSPNIRFGYVHHLFPSFKGDRPSRRPKLLASPMVSDNSTGCWSASIWVE